jgi:photosystem II stability/assembly factor-like uncharacterized protein
MAIGLSHGGSNIYSSDEQTGEVWVATKDGAVLLEREAPGKWRVSRAVLRGMHISSIIFERASGTIFAGAFFGSVHASSDGGKTWERRDNGLNIHDVYSLASNVIEGKVRLYAGTEPAHLFTSDDLGLHWSELPGLRSVPTAPTWSFPAPPHIAHTKFITFDPKDSNTIYACIEQGALLKSTNAGKSWTELNTIGYYRDNDRPAEHFYDVHKALIDPRDPKKILVTGGAGFYVSSDGGNRWERWTSSDWAEDVYPDGFVLNPGNPDTLFVAAAEHNPSTWRKTSYAGGRIYRSDDGGAHFRQLKGGLPETMKHEFGALCLEDANGTATVYAATTGGDVYCGEKDGEQWSLIASGLAPVSKKGHERLLAAS